MDNFSNEIIDFILERSNVAQRKLDQREDYSKLRKEEVEVLHDIIDNDPEIKRKYQVLDNITGQIEAMEEFQIYLQGVQDAMLFKQLLV